MAGRTIRERFGVTDEQLDSWEIDTSHGVFHGELRGGVVAGRPLMFGGQSG